jgi:hypothetical protein
MITTIRSIGSWQDQDWMMIWTRRWWRRSRRWTTGSMTVVGSCLIRHVLLESWQRILSNVRRPLTLADLVSEWRR